MVAASLAMFATYKPANPRLLNGPYPRGETRTFDQRVFEFRPEDESPRGASDMSATDLLLGQETKVTDLRPWRMRVCTRNPRPRRRRRLRRRDGGRAALRSVRSRLQR